MYETNQRIKVDLSGLTIKGVHFSQNVREALGTIVRQVSPEPPVYEVDLLFRESLNKSSVVAPAVL